MLKEDGERLSRPAKTWNILKRLPCLCIAALFSCVCAGCNIQIDLPFVSTPEPEPRMLVVTAADISVGSSFCMTYPGLDDFDWICSVDGIVTAEEGTVTGVKHGSAVVTATDGQEMYSSYVTVRTTRLGKRTSESENVLTVGDSLTFDAQIPDAEHVEWTAEDGGVLSFPEGYESAHTLTLTALAPGETVLSLQTEEERFDLSFLVMEADVGGDDEPVTPERQLLWSDEFDGDALDGAKWEYQLGVRDEYVNQGQTSYGPWFWGNNEQQYYTREAASVSEGTLKITAERKDGLPNDRKFTSARITTRDRGYWTYGYFEAKIKLPVGTGMWPAFWMVPQPAPGMGTGNKYGTWAANGEIDILEAKGRLQYDVSGTLHFGRQGQSTYRYGSAQLKTSIAEWHVYGFEWRADHMSWFVDGAEYFTLNNQAWYTQSELGKDNDTAPFDEPFYIILNLAVGGNFDGGREPDASFTSACMEVDYVRVYA